jgi:molybdate transport system regulatory protein
MLPEAVYAKQGCSRRKAGKPRKFFNTLGELRAYLEQERGRCQHLVVESNALALAHEGRAAESVVIFIDGVLGRTDFRRDAEALKECAQLRVTSGAAAREWRAALRKLLPEKRLVEAVLDALLDQQRFVGQSSLTVRSKVWFERDGERVFGAGLARLLEKVESQGTLTEAVAAAGMSYRYAWGMIRHAEQRLGLSLVHRQPGGRGGGGSSLTEEGRRLLEAYHAICLKVNDCADVVFAEYLPGGEVDGNQ